MIVPIHPRQAQTGTDSPFRIVYPDQPLAPVIAASPHSGRAYPADFLAVSRLDPHTIRRSEDCFVDDLMSDASSHGVPLLSASFPRAYCDVNREPWELDPAMFSDKLPSWCNTRSARINAGFGTIPRLVSSGLPIYADKLLFAEAEARIHTCWQPYHAALSGLIADARGTHDHCILLDCHSMPSDETRPRNRSMEPQFVLGDAHGTSCHPLLSRGVQRFLEDNGYRVQRNDPYAGGYVTRHYGKPMKGFHTLQIEICRSLYLDQHNYQPLAGFSQIRLLMSSLLQAVVDMAASLPR